MWGGAVKAPTLVDIPGHLTALEAILEAGGFDMQEAEPKNVIVMRQRSDRSWQGHTLDMRPHLKGQPSGMFMLQPRDIVYVPRTAISKLNQWIDQHINKIIPDIPLYYSLPVGDGNIIISP